MTFVVGYRLGFMLGPVPTVIGIGPIAVWAVVKRESVKMHTPSKIFRFEGSADFINALW